MVRDLLAWVAGSPLLEGHPFRSIVAQPAGPTVPEAWILGSSDYGAQVAAHFGLPYCFAHFITDGQGCADAIGLYRDSYRPSERNPTPYASVCVWALAAESEAAAEYQYSARALWRLSRDRGVFVAMPSPEQAAAHPWTDAERARAERTRARAIVGTGPQVAARLRALAYEVGADEVAVLSTAHDPAARRQSYRLIAEAAGLGADHVAMAAE
jgi:luciferase family oxidoreductase group 1